MRTHITIIVNKLLVSNSSKYIIGKPYHHMDNNLIELQINEVKKLYRKLQKEKQIH